MKERAKRQCGNETTARKVVERMPREGACQTAMREREDGRGGRAESGECLVKECAKRAMRKRENGQMQTSVPYWQELTGVLVAIRETRTSRVSSDETFEVRVNSVRERFTETGVLSTARERQHRSFNDETQVRGSAQRHYRETGKESVCKHQPQDVLRQRDEKVRSLILRVTPTIPRTDHFNAHFRQHRIGG